ncbi:unnamed protein product [Urochloa humidicola]
MQVGDPALRPEEESCFVPTSYAIDADLHDWESTALVSWAMRAPPNTGAKEVAAAIRDEFRLRQEEVNVTVHHPEAFLIKFKHRRHCEEAAKKGFAKRQGIEIHFIKWRSLNHALGVMLLYRVRLCLDGVPAHTWSEDIAEKIISKTCALEKVDTDLMFPEETKTIDLWAWTADPSSISKRVWLTFTSRARDPQLASVLITEKPPEHWQHGRKYCVFIHLDEIHDYTRATVDHKGAMTPTKRKLPGWHLGFADGTEVPGRLPETVPHQPLPPSQLFKARNARDAQDDRKSKDREGRGRRSYNNDHPDAEHLRGSRRHEDDEDDYGGGRGRRDHYLSKNGRVDYHRERERSPRRRDWGYGGPHDGGRRHTEVHLAGFNPLPEQHILQSNDHLQLQTLFLQQAAALQEAAHAFLAARGATFPLQSPSLVDQLQDYVHKAVALAAQLGMGTEGPGQTNGNEASSGCLAATARDLPRHHAAPLVPVSGVFTRLKAALPDDNAPLGYTATEEDDNTMAELQQALRSMELQAAMGEPFFGRLPESPIFRGGHLVTQQLHDVLMPMAALQNIELHAPVEVPFVGPLPVTPTAATTSPGPVRTGIANLFTTPTPAILHHQQPPAPPRQASDPSPAPRRRNRRTFDMSKVRRSARLANAPQMSAMRRAQRNLCRKLGLLADDLAPVERALQEYLASFTGPLPEEIIAALTTIFNLDDGETEDMDVALAELVGDGIGELEEAGAIAAA